MYIVRMLCLSALLVTWVSVHVSAEESRFSVEGDSAVVVDQVTGLMWPLQDNGSDINWSAAVDFCENFIHGGFTDWRMPTQEELASLYEVQAAETTEYYIIPVINISACCLWTSDTDKAGVGSFDFGYGKKDWGHPMSTVDARVLPVRSTQ